MIRSLILIGYSQMMMYLQLTGKLDQFINIHYQYLAVISMVLSLLLGLIQLYFWVREDPKQNKSHAHHHEDHDHTMSRSQKLVAYVLLVLPMIVGLLFPTVSLDATIVQAKGFQFPVSKESVGDPEMNTQYLQPNTSIYYNKEDYQKQMDGLRKKYIKDGKLTVTEENYLEVMELIYNYPSEFINRPIHYEGFLFKAPKNQGDFLFRFGIIHCVADSGVFGLRVFLPDGTTATDNEWFSVDGVIESDYYEPFQRDLPTVKVEKIKKIDAPKNEYVYRTF
ncbi:membrane protein [Enterococcus sulfureus ATCC 49903]|uniref:Membrane protein n=1 Tax=Enterococcus sulfureus ATCC 49903 TaxID=1140003 RepID=S0NPX7_9ENTE|nr:TIGR03943 family protein [Enterococcus sulfureus]EOT47158.1 membrane protein [Enterococcus sulfureus ATCC 49903]EOT83547.1 membrane protein [Enterococcus sulfureus ATCC 49903]